MPVEFVMVLPDRSSYVARENRRVILWVASLKPAPPTQERGGAGCWRKHSINNVDSVFTSHGLHDRWRAILCFTGLQLCSKQAVALSA